MKNFKKLDENQLMKKNGGLNCATGSILAGATYMALAGGPAGVLGGLMFGAGAYIACNAF